MEGLYMAVIQAYARLYMLHDDSHNLYFIVIAENACGSGALSGLEISWRFEIHAQGNVGHIPLLCNLTDAFAVC